MFKFCGENTMQCTRFVTAQKWDNEIKAVSLLFAMCLRKWIVIDKQK